MDRSAAVNPVRMMKILVIDEEFPVPLNSGKRIRTFNLYRELSKSNEVSYLAYGDARTDAGRVLRENNIKPFSVPKPDRTQAGIRFYVRLFLNLFSRYPYIVTSHYTKAFKRAFSRLIEENQYDIIICEWTPYAMFIKDLSFPKKVIVTHNVESRIWRRYRDTESNPVKKIYIAIQYKKILAFEKKCFKWADGVTAVSKDEASVIREFDFGGQLEVIENGVDIDYFRPLDTAIDPDMLVTTGSMDWRPNQDAAVFFATEIFPIIKQINSQVRATFIGRNPPGKIRGLEKIDGITIVGTVDDVRPYIAEAALFIVPLRVGGGTRLKILEALAMKKAVVSTTVGAEGLMVTDNRNIILADDKKQFADAVIRCLEDYSLRSRLGEEGRILVEKHYCWRDLGRKLNDFLESIVNS